ncbi:MAG: sigma-54-dependent Fis family transcriptional regulator [Gammaproteobacteria bacterium]|nr:sigma-54-dependent Fis family transcriptional regulator [Gammaproteobacteria bacterium]
MTRSPLALVVDDEPDIRELLEITLARMGIECQVAADLGTARRALERTRFDICLTDMRLPDGDGLDLVAHIQRNHANTPVAVITAHGSMESAIQALKSGAFDFVTKPVDLQGLRRLVEIALKLGDPAGETGPRLIGESAAMRQTRATIAKLARSQAPVYISGESGVGKELVARMIHAQGPRAAQPFVPVNCGAIPGDLIESELFGHKKGSFTGAVADKPGLFQAAHGGTLFLDELAELPLQLQVKLLRAIQEKSVRPIGSQAEVVVDVRVLSATHKDLAALVQRGEFRQDLFYRINVIELRVPPLRDRGEDLAPLTDHILGRLAAESGTARPRLQAEAERALRDYAFPGNVRELENILERAMTLCEGDVIRVADLQLPGAGGTPAGAPPAANVPLAPYLDELERQRILAALERTRWNRTAAARLLGISFRALRYRLAKLGLDRPGEE